MLIIDDEVECADAMQVGLSDDRLKITTSSNATEGIELLNILRPDILMTDYAMPEHNGIELVTLARNIKPWMTIILFTGMSMDSLRREAIQRGVDYIVPKPLSFGEMHDYLENSIRKMDALEKMFQPQQNDDIHLNIENTMILDLCRKLSHMRQTGALIVISDNDPGQIFFNNGDIIHAQNRSLKGENAFLAMAHWKCRSGRFLKAASNPENTIFSKPEELFLTACNEPQPN